MLGKEEEKGEEKEEKLNDLYGSERKRKNRNR